jgi:hypothetical protein
MTVYSPKGKNTGAAVIVFPGGGYDLAIDLEGTEVQIIDATGITCVLPKCAGSGTVSEIGTVSKGEPIRNPIALQDAQRVVGCASASGGISIRQDRVLVAPGTWWRL